jgi:hypothetical protein
MARAPQLKQAVLARVRQLAPQPKRDQDPDRVAAMLAAIEAGVDSWLEHLREGESEDFNLPAAAWANARLAAQDRLPLSSTLQSYVTGYLVSWEFIVEEATKLGGTEAERVALLQRVAVLEMAYLNQLITHVSDEYMRERERMARSREQRAIRLVREVLNGADVPVGELGYDLHGHHLCLVVAGEQPDGIAHRLGEALDRQLLVIPQTERSAWVWLGGRAPLEPGLITASLGRVEPADQMLALGEPAVGVAGFRQTHQEALAAYAVAQRLPAPVTRYGDVSLVAWGLREESLGRAFVRRYLDRLGDPTGRGSVLRETLTAYFASGHNASSAAASLGVHERTVTYRLRTIEERIACSIHSCRAELETALRLEQALTSWPAPEVGTGRHA